MYHGVPRNTGNIISPENTKIPQSSNAAPGGFLRRAEAARATEFHEDHRTATMNISPGPQIIIRNEIALESLINRRAANVVALGISRAASTEGDDCDFSHRESSSVRIRRMLSVSPWKHYLFLRFFVYFLDVYKKNSCDNYYKI